jgi:hypothetical protein
MNPPLPLLLSSFGGEVPSTTIVIVAIPSEMVNDFDGGFLLLLMTR